MKSRAFFSAVFALIILCPASRAFGQGVVVPIFCTQRPCRPVSTPLPVPNVLPVKSIDLQTKIVGQTATTRVEQVFRNDTPYTLEGTYFFPIPDDASIVEFAIWENGKKLVGEVRTREEARRIYEEIVRRQRDPGLLEYSGKNLFQASIFPIPANSDKKLELSYSQVLKADSGTVAYRYPLGTGRNFAVPVLPMAIDGPARSVASMPTFGRISGRIEIGAKGGLRNIYSPTHNIDVSRRGDNSAVITFESIGNDNDFQLFYGVSDEDFAATLLTNREPGKDGYFLLMLSPTEKFNENEIVSKDIVFVLDTSGSMADEGKIEKARAALLFGIRSLRDGDRFNVINFSGEEHLMERGLISAGAAGKRRGEDFVNSLRPTGGTNIDGALEASLKQFEKVDRPKMLVFITDGLPTVGTVQADKIAANVKAGNSAGVRIFPFGVGYDVNTALLDRLGSDNFGISDYVQPKEDIELKVSNFFSRVSSPVLSGIEVDFGGVETDLTYPRKVTDLFRGMQIVLIGRYKNEADLNNVSLTLRGRNGTESRTFRYANLDFPLRSEDNDFLPRLWAVRRVGWLIEQIRANGETKEQRDEVTDLGTRYGIVTPYTSFLATDGSFQAASPVDGRARNELRRAAADKMTSAAGADAVLQSVRQNSMQSETRIAPAKSKDAEEDVLIRDSRTNRFVGTKNFFKQNDIWVDAEYDTASASAQTVVKFASGEYFDLARREPSLAKYLALGKQLIIVWKGRVYKIVE